MYIVSVCAVHMHIYHHTLVQYKCSSSAISTTRMGACAFMIQRMVPGIYDMPKS